MKARAVLALLLAASTPGALCFKAGLKVRQQLQATAPNPIRKVVTLLQELQAKVTEEGKTEEALYEKYTCYCSKNKDGLTASIEAARNKIDNMNSQVKEAIEKKAQTEQDLKQHQQAREDAKTAIAEATSLREKEAAAFAAADADYKTNLEALAKATAALERGVAGSFLQSRAASTLKNYAMLKAELSDVSRELLLSFLSGSDRYSPKSNEIVGILKQLADDMKKSKDEAASTEAASEASFKDLIAAKTKEIEALQAQIEQEQLRIGELAVLAATGEADLKATQSALDADAKFLSELETGCATKAKEWEEVKKQRAEELVALSETISLLNSDEALEIFKQALPSPGASFMQLQMGTQAVRQRALAVIQQGLRAMPSGSPATELSLVALALRGKKQGFEKVLSMINEMVDTLKKEQQDDDSKVQYCEAQLHAAEDEHKALEQSAADSDTAVAEMEGSIAKLKEEIKALEESIAALDKSVADATAQRQAEAKAYQELVVQDNAAKELLLMAKNRLQKFYNPKLHVTTPAPELSEEDRLAAAVRQTSLVQLYHLRHREAPPPPPETFKPFQKKGQETAGVMEMMNLLVADLEKELTTEGVEEKEAQKDYEKLVAEAAQKRAQDSAAATERASSVAAQEEALQAEKDRKAGTLRELAAVVERIGALHTECDWLQQHYDVRKEARTTEISGLQNAHAVLSGADYALL